MREFDKGFWVKDNCNGCGICVKVCLVKNVELVEGKPEWKHSCQQCFACFHWCPQEAIEYKKSTEGRIRYRNPEVSVRDFIKGEE